MMELAPREKLAMLGAEALSDAELLAIFLRTGSYGTKVMVLAQQMLNEWGSLYRIMTASQEELGVMKGLGIAKITQLHAVAELGRRFFTSQLARENVIENLRVSRYYLHSMMAHLDRQVCSAMFHDNAHSGLHANDMFCAPISSVEACIRYVVA